MNEKQKVPMKFSAVFRDELKVLGKLPCSKQDPHETALQDKTQNIEIIALESMLSGVAFSGGGIRSATFNLGVIQSLVKNDHLSKFDYLSTVSGGGYIGSWLSAQLQRTNNNGETTNTFQNEIKDSTKTGLEPQAIIWLRQYSNYLTPKKGLTGDTFSAIGTWLRNTLLNQVTLGLFFASLFLLPQVVLLKLNSLRWLETQYSSQWLLLSALLIVSAIILCATNLPKLRCCADRKCTEAIKKEARQPTLLIVPFSVFAAYSLSLWIYSTSLWTNAWTNVGTQLDEPINLLQSLLLKSPLIGDSGQTLSPLLTDIQSRWSPIVIAGMFAFIYVVPWVIAAIRSLLKPELQRCAQCPHTQDEDILQTTQASAPSQFKFALGNILSSIIAGALGGWLIYLLSHAVAQQSADIRLWWATGFGTPLLLMIFCLVLVLHQGLMARLFRISQLEWWARMGGYVLLVAAAWAGIHVLLIYAPPLLNYLESQFIATGGVVWAAHSLAGVLFGKSAATSGQHNTLWKERIARAAPYVFVLGYLIAISWGVHALMYQFGKPNTTYLIQPDNNDPFRIFLTQAVEINNNADVISLGIVLAAGVAAFFILAWRLDVNLFSIHHFYRNRLVRCYLGAGRSNERVPNAFTGFDPCDDIKMADLKQRPLHLINTAINLVHDDNLAWQDRKAYSFTFSPIACGFEYPPNAGLPGGGYFKSEQYMNGVRVGTAMAASGAAASPNMGYHSSPAVAFLLTIFNVRLGHWCPNTEARAFRQCAIGRDSPAMGGEYLLKELFGQSDDKNAFVYLSDGGHFENLGVYELVRRRCRYIMVVDVGQDENRTFEDAANMIRKCYIDFGVTIDIKLDALHSHPDGNSLGCYALGDISYPASAEGGRSKENDNWGVLLYIKPSLLANIPEDIRQYAKTNPDFPHQPTGDQFFDEAQFESYRHLGNYLMDVVLNSVSQEKTPGGISWM